MISQIRKPSQSIIIFSIIYHLDPPLTGENHNQIIVYMEGKQAEIARNCIKKLLQENKELTRVKKQELDL